MLAQRVSAHLSQVGERAHFSSVLHVPFARKEAHAEPSAEFRTLRDVRDRLGERAHTLLATDLLSPASPVAGRRALPN